MRAPLPSGASTTIRPSVSAARRLLRATKLHAAGGVPGGRSEISAPALTIWPPSRRAPWRNPPGAGLGNTPIVLPPALSAASCAASSIPRAAPLTTTHPSATQVAAIARADASPCALGCRVPTMPIAGRRNTEGSPCTQSGRRRSLSGLRPSGTWRRSGISASPGRIFRISEHQESAAPRPVPTRQMTPGRPADLQHKRSL